MLICLCDLAPEESLSEPFMITWNLYQQSNAPIHDCNPVLSTLTNHYGWHANSCPICERNLSKHLHFMLWNCCHRQVHRYCTEFSHAEFTNIKKCAPWFCGICNENISPSKYWRWKWIPVYNTKLWQMLINDLKIFDQFEINGNDDNIIEYQGDLDPAQNYFNQLAHYFRRSSNYYSEDTLNKVICQKTYSNKFRSFFSDTC